MVSQVRCLRADCVGDWFATVVLIASMVYVVVVKWENVRVFYWLLNSGQCNTITTVGKLIQNIDE